MSNWLKAHIVKVRSRGDREEVKLQMFDRDGTPLDLSTGSSGSGGVEESFFPMPLAVFDFSDRSSVVREFEVQGACFPQPYGFVLPGFVNLQSQGAVSDWSTVYQSDALGGRSAIVISSEDEEVMFVGDSETPVDSPVRFVVAKLDEVVEQRALTGVNAGDFSHLITWDDDGTVCWGVLFYFDDSYHFRTTNAPVDTDLHVYCMNHAVDSAGIYIDGVLWPWTDEDPSGWLDRPVIYVNFDTFMGSGSNYPGTLNEFMPPLRLGEVRIYDQGIYPFITELSSLLKLKWQGFVTSSMEPLGFGVNGVAFDFPTDSLPKQDQILIWNNGEWGAGPRYATHVATESNPILGPGGQQPYVFTPSVSTIFAIEFRIEVLDGSIDSFGLYRHARNALGEEIVEGATDLTAGSRVYGYSGPGGNEISTWTAIAFLYGGDYGDVVRGNLVAGEEGGSFLTHFFVTALQ